MKIDFSQGSWSGGVLDYAYSYRFEETPVFLQKPDCIENRENPRATYGFDNISLLTRETFRPGVTISTRCAFEDLGAPLLVLAPWVEADARGVTRYGDYIEIVLWKTASMSGGCGWKRGKLPGSSCWGWISALRKVRSTPSASP